MKMAVALARLAGGVGDVGTFYSDGANHTNATGWRAIFAHENVNITATSPTIAGSLVNVPLPSGAVWFGKFTAVQATGAVTLYDMV